jgi:hypothetical protein
MIITPEELLAGKGLTYDIEVPASAVAAGGAGPRNGESKKIRLRPLTIKDVQLIARAAQDDEVLTSVLMIQRAVLEPLLKQTEIAEMPGGLVRFLVEHINRISGLSTGDEELKEIAGSPLVQAFFVLAKEFNWTPQQIKQMTVGQVIGYLELLNQTKRAS